MSEAAVAVRQEQNAPVPIVSEAASFLSMIERASRDPAVDIDKMRQLFAWKKEIEADAAQKEFNAAMAAAQAEIKPVAKNADNTQTKSRYATLDAIDEAISPIVARHGFGISYDTADSPLESCYRVTCEVTHVGGHAKTYHADVPIDGAGFKGTANKTATHAFASTITYGRRILKMMVFDVSTKNALRDDDGNAAGGAPEPEFITEGQVMDLRDLILSMNGNEVALLKAMGLESLSLIYADKFEDAKNLIRQKGRV